MHENFDIKTLLDSALEHDNGLSICTKGLEETRRIRRKLYNWRDKARKQGMDKYDRLSFVLFDQGELFIVPRKDDPLKREIQVSFVRELEPHERPEKIIARGKCRAGVLLEGFDYHA
ncbi:MAG: hypothetical protein EOM12_12025 [Verrucomicrobiae bacterium]|nr:hypothetical protein [Verrucomicrobiae bacterium]